MRPLPREKITGFLDVLENEEIPNPDNELMGESLKVEIERALSKLTKREAEVIRLYFGIGREHKIEPNDLDRKSTRLNSSHVAISYAVFCLKKKKKKHTVGKNKSSRNTL